MIIISDLQFHQIQTDKKSIENHYCFYKDIIYGKKVPISTEMQDGVQQQTIELDRMQNNQVLIVEKLSELLPIFPDRLITISSQPIPKKSLKNRWWHASGYSMICRAILEKKKAHNQVFWHKKDLQI